MYFISLPQLGLRLILLRFTHIRCFKVRSIVERNWRYRDIPLYQTSLTDNLINVRRQIKNF
jgi:hypothetical protein